MMTVIIFLVDCCVIGLLFLRKNDGKNDDGKNDDGKNDGKLL
tara:strand:+ start:391 stop:516 length:126 start_codon:yes stop_codon:yes gene_type:complete